jgi:PAS domain S-box-containing protein
MSGTGVRTTAGTSRLPTTMAAAPYTVSATTPQDGVNAHVATVFFGIAAVVCVAAGVVVLSLSGSAGEAMRHVGLATALGYAALLAGAAAVARRGRVRLGVLVGLGATLVCTTLYAAVGGLGIHALLLGAYAIIVLVAGVVVGMRVALVFAALCLGALLAMYAAELRGWLPGMPLVGAVPLATRLLADILLLAMALAFSWMLARIVHSSLAEARTQEDRFRALLAIASDWYWEQDEHFRFTCISSAVENRTGIAPDTHLGKTRWELPELELTDAQWAAHRAELEAHRPFRNFVMRRTDRDGRPVFVSVSGEPVFDAQGRFRGYRGVGRNVTEEVEARRALELGERRYRELFMRSPSPFIIHRHGFVLVANDAAARLFGYPSAEAMVGLAMVELNHPESRLFSAQRIARMEATPVGGSVPTGEIRMRRRDGQDLFVQASVVRVDHRDGPASLSTYFDLTERKRAEARLARSEAMFSQLFEAGADSIIVTEAASGRVVLANQGFARITGIAVEAARGRTTVELGIWADLEQRNVFIGRLLAERRLRDFPMRLRRADGEELSVVLSSALFELEGTRYAVTIGRDVTQTEQARLQYEAMFKNASVGIAFTRDRVFQHVNPRFAQMLGWPPDELIGQPGAAVWPTPQDYAEVGRRYGPLLGRGEGVDFEATLRRRDGTTFLGRMRARAIDPHNPAGGGTIWIVEDVTERRDWERALAAARDEAEAANRAKSAFLANTSHEIRTPLNGLLGLARLALDPKASSAQQREYLELIAENAQSLAAIISDILDLSKIEAGKLVLDEAAFDVRELLESTFTAYRALAAERGLAFELAVDPQVLRYARGDAVRIRQILGNFLSNAVKFTLRGRIELRVEARGDDGPAAQRVRFAVADTGIGIDAATRERLFSPFMQADQTTTRRFGGTGLGLSICRQLAHLMGGAVGVESEVDRGSTFWFELALARAGAPAAAAPGATADAGAGLQGARVLLVEDNPVNMLIAETLLANWGVEVVQATDGRQAVDAVEREPGRFDAVLMDVHMPVMSGHEATVELRKRYGADELPIIALTAAALAFEQQQSLALGMNDFIAKPFDAARLRELLVYWTARRRACSRRAA